MSKKDDYIEMILQTNEWFDNKKEQLQLLIDSKSDSKICFQGKEGEKVELPEEMKKGFFFGVQTALEVFGDFPIKITKSNDSN